MRIFGQPIDLPDTIRQGRVADAPACAAIEHRAGLMFAQSPYPEIAADTAAKPDGFAQAAQLGRLLVSLAENGDIAGFLIWEMESYSLHICELDVDPAFQRQGRARGLIAALGEIAHMLDRDALTLTTFADIAWNGPAYAQMGFEELSADEWTDECRQETKLLKRSGTDISNRIAMRFWL